MLDVVFPLAAAAAAVVAGAAATEDAPPVVFLVSPNLLLLFPLVVRHITTRAGLVFTLILRKFIVSVSVSRD